MGKRKALLILSIMVLLATGYILMLLSNITTVLEDLVIDEPTYQVIVYKVVEEVEVVKEVIVEKEVEPDDILDEDTKLLAQIIHAEAKGEPYEGKLAVGNVVMNRVEHPYYPDTIEGVIFQKGQFSPVSSGSIYNEPDKDSIKAAKEVLAGREVVNDEVLYFYNPDIATDSWIFTTNTVKKIGSHVFSTN